MYYHLWKQSFTGYRFVDIWGISKKDLASLAGVELTIDQGCTGAISAMFQVMQQRSVVEQLKALGFQDVAGIK